MMTNPRNAGKLGVSAKSPRASAASARTRIRRLAPKLIVVATALLVAAVLAEAMVRLARPGFPGFRVPQVEHRPVDGLGFEMIPSQVAYSFASRVIVNSQGFRGPEVRPETASDELRVLCLGDSITFGVGVEEADPYPRQLEAMLASLWPHRDPEVVNAGVQRYFTYQEIDQLSAIGPRLRPRIVTLGVYPNDLAERPTTVTAREYDNEREQAATSFRRRVPLVYSLVKNSAALEFAKILYLSRGEGENFVTRAFSGVATERDERRWEAFERELETFARLASEMSFVPILVTIPARAQIAQDMPESLYPARILEMARRLDIAAASPVDRFKESLRAGADPYLPWDDHLSRVGHRLVADVLREQIQRLDHEAPVMGSR